MANWFDNLMVWWGNPSAQATNQQNQDSLSAYAKNLYDSGTITESKYQDYVRQIEGTSIDNTIDNSYNVGLGASPSQDFVDTYASELKALPNAIGSTVGGIVSDTSAGLMKQIWWVVLLVVGALVFWVWFRKNAI